MNQKYVSFDVCCQIAKSVKAEGNKVVFVHGMFDLLHKGHLHMLHQAKKYGDLLIIGLDCDQLIKTLKGNDRPIRHFDERCFMLSQIQTVDLIFKIQNPQDGDLDSSYLKIYETLMPDILVTSISAGKYGALKRSKAQAYNIQFIDIECINEVSTTQLINKIKKN